jgi:hypothetical protein
MAPSTIGRGLKELGEEEAPGRVRRPGAGRQPAIAKDPTLISDLESGSWRSRLVCCAEAISRLTCPQMFRPALIAFEFEIVFRPR